LFMKINEMRAMSILEARKQISELRTELAKERAVTAGGTKPENPGKIRGIKKKVARLLTVINEKFRAGEIEEVQEEKSTKETPAKTKAPIKKAIKKTTKKKKKTVGKKKVIKSKRKKNPAKKRKNPSKKVNAKKVKKEKRKKKGKKEVKKS